MSDRSEVFTSCAAGGGENGLLEVGSAEVVANGEISVLVGVGVSRWLEFEFGGVGVATGGVHTTLDDEVGIVVVAEDPIEGV